MQEYMQEVEGVRNSGNNNAFSPLTPFTIYSTSSASSLTTNSSTATSTLYPSSSTLSTLSSLSLVEVSKKLGVDEGQLRLFVFGVEMLLGNYRQRRGGQSGVSKHRVQV